MNRGAKDHDTPDEGKVLKSFKVPPDLWAAAQDAVEWRGDPSVSYVIRRALAQYVRSTQKRKENHNQRSEE